MKKIIIILLTSILFISILFISILFIQSTVAYALTESDEQASFTDIKGHWAENIIEKHYDMGMLKGYPDITFKPDQSILRSELVTLINRYFGLTKEAETNFEDVSKNDWYEEDAAKAKYYQYIEEMQMQPKEKATREDIINMISLLIDTEEQDYKGKELIFKDLAGLDEETKENIKIFSQLGYIKGYEDGTFRPDSLIKRAEITTILESTLGYIVKTQEDIDNLPEGVEKITIISSDILIENKEIEGNLYISPGVNGEITIKNTEVDGQIEIAGGNKDKSIVLENVETEKVVVTKAKETPKVEIKGKSKIDELKTKSKSDIDILGNTEIKEVNIKSETGLKLGDKSDINTLVTEGQTKLETSKESKIGKLEAKAKTQVTGEGVIKKAYVKNKEVNIENKPTYTKVYSNAGKVSIGGKEISSRNDDSESHRSSSTQDTTAPTISDSTITLSNIALNSVDLTWIKATDDTTNSENLEYKVYYSTSNNIDTVENIETNGTAVGDYETDINTKTVSGLTEDTKYYFNVIVKDEKGNKACYSTISQTTIAPVTITGISIKTTPTKTNYEKGESLDLTGLVVTLTKSDSFTEDVNYADLGTKGITTSPNNGTALNTTDTTVTVSLSSLNTNFRITVEEPTASVMEGSGTPEKPFVINNIEGLVAIGRGLTVDGVHDYRLDSNYELGKDLDFTLDDSYLDPSGKDILDVDNDNNKEETLKDALTKENDSDTGKGFNPIGEKYNRFEGSFDGKEHKIINLYINRENEDYIGLFANVTDGAISDTYIINANVTGDFAVGALVGYYSSDKPLKNCYAISTITGGEIVGGLVGYSYYTKIENCYSNSTVTGNKNTGGLIGYSYSSLIKNCYSNSTVTGKSKRVFVSIRKSFGIGGLIGLIYDTTIERCYTSGNITGEISIGGIVGVNDTESIITDSYSLCNVEGFSESVGGISGYNESRAVVKNCYSFGTIKGDNYTGGITGKNYEGTIYNSIVFNSCITDNPNTGRITGSNINYNGIANEIKNNYAYENTIIKINEVDKTLDIGLNTLDGEDITAENFKLESFYNNAANWYVTEDTPLWDFTNVWEIKDGADRPTLKGVGNDDGKISLPEDKTAPTISDSTITLSNIALNSINLTWIKATDDTTDSSDLDYKVYYSTNNNLNTVENIEANGTAVGDYEKDINTKTATGLTENTTYYFNVIVKDEKGNKTCYTSVSKTTLAPVTIKGIGIETTPTKTNYTEGENLDLTGLVVTLTKSDGSTEDVNYADFGTKGITTIPANGTALNTTNNDVTVNLNSLSASFNISVEKASTSGSGGTETSETTGLGTPEKPFIINSIEGLVSIGRGLVIDGVNDYSLDSNYELGKDLDFTSNDCYLDPRGKDVLDVDEDNDTDETLKDALTKADDSDTGKGFNPIGDKNNRFGGSFDGKEHKIINLYINRENEEYIGLFANVNDGVIANTYIVNANVTGDFIVGALVAYYDSDKPLKNCYATSIVTGVEAVGGLIGFNDSTTIEKCYSISTVRGSGLLGGLIGCNFSSLIKNCYSDSIIIGDSTGYDIGGLIGKLYYSTIEKCYSSGTTTGNRNVGGLVGRNYTESIITDSYSLCNIEGFSESVGGISGYNESKAVVKNCYSIGTIKGNNYTGGITGKNAGGSKIYNSIVFNSHINGKGQTVVGRIAGYSYSYTSAKSEVKNNYAYENTIIKINGVDKTLDIGLDTLDGEDITTENFKSLDFYTDASKWNTEGENTLWDFTNVWEIKGGADRPTLKNVGN